MTDQSDNSTPKKTPAQIMSELVARKAEAAKAKGGGVRPGSAERAAAALSSSKSKPASRK